MENIDALRKRRAEMRQADGVRDNLLDDLLQKVADMQKTMDRNAFVMVLIDGDCMPFVIDLVKQGITGGEKAATLLRQAIFDYLRYDEGFKLDSKIIIKVYANLRGLSKTYADKGILHNVAAFSEFVLGFNKAHPLSDFVDAGNHKEAADSKLKENFNINVYNVHCKHIIFGASADNSYASFLSSFLIDTDISTRVRLLEGPPFSFEFRNVAAKLKHTKFGNVFSTELISNQPIQHTKWRRSQEVDVSHWSSTSTKAPMAERLKAVPTPYATQVAKNDPATSASRRLVHPADLLHFDDDDQDDDQDTGTESDGVNLSTGSKEDSADALPTSLSGQTGMQPGSGGLKMEEVVTALTDSTWSCLQDTPEGLDFGVVKRKVEQQLGLTNDFWGHKGDAWYERTKNIIKIAVEDWVEQTDKPPPGNSTWMLRRFPAGESPSAILKSPAAKLWRTDRRNLSSETPTWSENVPSSCRVPNADTNSPPQWAGTNAPVTLPWRKKHSLSTTAGETALDPPNSRELQHIVHRNRNGQRIDFPRNITIKPSDLDQLTRRNPRLCNNNYLTHGCTKQGCIYDHNSVLTDQEFATLAHVSRSVRCHAGSECIDLRCVKGHICPSGKNCTRGHQCRFYDVHGIDTEEASPVTGNAGWEVDVDGGSGWNDQSGSDRVA